MFFNTACSMKGKHEQRFSMEEQKENIINNNVTSPADSIRGEQPVAQGTTRNNDAEDNGTSQDGVPNDVLATPSSLGEKSGSKVHSQNNWDEYPKESREVIGSNVSDSNDSKGYENDEIATPDEIEAFLRSRREQKDKEKALQKERRNYCEDPYEGDSEMLQAKQDSSIDPYLEPDSVIPKVKYQETPFLSRGCNHCPISYEPINETERHSCSKLAVKNWLEGIQQPQMTPFDCVEVRFKNNRKEFFRLPFGINVAEGDVVAVEGMPGHDVGIVSLAGDLCRIQMKKKHVDPTSDNIRKLFRRAKSSDIERWSAAIHEEKHALSKTRRIADDLGLVMKMNDVEFQGDRSKAIFYYTADERVDFRTLIKVLAEEFHVRVEMKQIGVRQEASKVGGLGTCGRELCCSTWLTNFKSVTTGVAKAQQILPNPQKLAGQCGKLKCCLNFEYEVYVDALKKFPPAHVALHFKKGLALYKKTDVFRSIMWYAYEGSNDLYALKAEAVKDIIEKNRHQEYPEQMEDFVVELMSTSALEQETSESEFENAIKQMADTGNEVVNDDSDNFRDNSNGRNGHRDRNNRRDRNERREKNDIRGGNDQGDRNNNPGKPRDSRGMRGNKELYDFKNNCENRSFRVNRDNRGRNEGGEHSGRSNRHRNEKNKRNDRGEHGDFGNRNERRDNREPQDQAKNRT